MTFRERMKRSHKRMLWTVTGAGTFLAAMLTVGAILFTTPQHTGEFTLADRVEAIQASEGPSAATRLGPNLDRRIKEWLDVQSNAKFGQLSENLQTLVKTRLEEGTAYIHFRDGLAEIPPPDRAKSLAELTRTEERFNAADAAVAVPWRLGNDRRDATARSMS